MKTHFRNKSKYCTTGPSNHNPGNNNNNNSSSSGAAEVSVPIPTTSIRSVADVVDSSDEHYMRNHCRSEWNREIQDLQKQLRQPTSQSSNRAKTNTNVHSKNQENCQKTMSSMYKERHCRDKVESDLDLDDYEETNEQMLAGDYKVMSEMPMSIGGYFQFSTEKNWTAADSDEQSQLERTEASEYFTLNLRLLNLGLTTIPFYKRLDYPANLFTGKQIEAMENLSNSAEKAYQQVLKDHIKNPRSLKNEKEKEKDAEGNTEEKNKEAPIVSDELDELLNITDTATNPISSINTSSGPVATSPLQPNLKERPTTAAARNNSEVAEVNKNDIQEWLDNVLEE